MKLKQTIAALSLALAATALLAPNASRAQATGDKKVIEMGYDIPDTAYMRKNIAEMEKIPFDGVVFRVVTKDDGGKAHPFIREAWGGREFGASEVKPAIEDLKATKFTKFTDNFVRMNTQPGVDFYDDYSTVVHNAAIAARIAKQGGVKGILLDTENYVDAQNKNRFFTFKDRTHPERSWVEYVGQARKRGREVMAAFQREYPGVTVLLTYGYSFPWNRTGRGGRALSDERNAYNLLAPFLDGMVEEASGGTKMVELNEWTFSLGNETERKAAYQETNRSLLPIVANPTKYNDVMSIGQAIMLDFQDPRNPNIGKDWDPVATNKNFFPPDKFISTLKGALRNSDKYVWVYAQRVRFWPRANLPESYISGIEIAKRTYK